MIWLLLFLIFAVLYPNDARSVFEGVGIAILFMMMAFMLLILYYAITN